MRYRRLQLDELEEVRDQFVQFLASNSVVATEWEKIKEEEPTKANKLIEMFSDIVFDSVLERIDYLEHKMPKELRLFRCKKEKIELIGLKVAERLHIDFTKNQSTQEMLMAVQHAPAGTIQIFSAEKTYKIDRKQELFKLMEGGALISNGQMFETLLQLRTAK